MTYSDKYGTFFGRQDGNGDVTVLRVEDGSAATRLDASVYPRITVCDAAGAAVVIDDDVSARYDHPGGITLTLHDAMRLGIEVEG